MLPYFPRRNTASRLNQNEAPAIIASGALPVALRNALLNF
jgi:hypothetical protein